MSPNIKISHKLYSDLEKQAQGFETPEQVIARLLEKVKGVAGPQESSRDTPVGKTRDYTKYIYDEDEYGKGRLVLAVVKGFVKERKETSYDDLYEVFPRNLQGSLGVFAKIADVNILANRYFLKRNEQVALSDCVVAVCSQWGMDNINKFIDAAEELEIEIKKIGKSQVNPRRVTMKRPAKLRGLVIEMWRDAGRPNWNYAETKSICLKANDELKSRKLNPAKRFREQVEKGDQTYIEQWVFGCHFEWLNPR
jgi:hypothetical protein